MRKKSKEEERNEAAREVALTMKRMLTGMRLLLEAGLEPDGLTLAQLRMLGALDEQTELSSAELARSSFVTPQSMQALVVRAEREGWIVRVPSPENRRILTAKLTPRGRTVFEQGRKAWESLAREMWAETSLKELRALNETLSAAVDRLQPKLDALHAPGELS